jgi:hypothetical protein
MRSVSLNTVLIDCPYCGENIEMVIDCSIDFQKYIEDCDVCCRPVSLLVKVGEEGDIDINARHENE